ncbi:MAG TPA: hypothetical protein VHZ54_10470 [Solirubrobacterales bacterium]|jgi:hypothetical protein|nr:hypothetical protein [Solirubrobacterales bacterium]
MSPPGHRTPWSGDGEARHLFALVQAACAAGDDLPTRLEAGLRTVLETLAADPELAYRLTVAPYLGADDEALDAQREWIARFGALLREAAAGDPRASTEPSFLAPFLVGGVRFLIARLVIKGEGSDLLRLLPGTLETLLAYYFEPGEPRPLARVALGGHD